MFSTKKEQNQRHRALAHRTVTYSLQCQDVQKLWWYPIEWSVNGLISIILYLCSFHWYKAIRNPLQKWFCMGTLKATESLSDALNVLFFALLSGETFQYLPSKSMPDIIKVSAWYHNPPINSCIGVFWSISNKNAILSN